jgi:hypothetical protein
MTRSSKFLLYFCHDERILLWSWILDAHKFFVILREINMPRMLTYQSNVSFVET